MVNSPKPTQAATSVTSRDQSVAAPLVWEPEFSLGQLYNSGLFLLGYAPEIIHFTTRLLDGYGPEYGTLDAALGQAPSHTFTLTNPDAKTTGPITIALTGSSAFSKTADTCTGTKLAPNDTCTVTVNYAPTRN